MQKICSSTHTTWCCNLRLSKIRTRRKSFRGKMNVAMAPWIHTRWHQLILSLLERLKSLDQCHRLWTLSPSIPLTGETTVMIDISKITASFREWKAPLGSPSPPVSKHLPFPYPGVICDRRHFLVPQESLGWEMIKFAFSHSRSKSVIAWNLISKCLKSIFISLTLWDWVLRLEGRNMEF